MIYCKMPEGVFHFRIAGVLIRNGKILVQRGINDQAYALPGGHVEMFERSEDTLVREFREEMKANVKVGRLLWIQEQVWEWNSSRHHSLCLYYLVEFEGEPGIPLDGVFRSAAGNDTEIEFSWVALANLGTMEFYPEFMRHRRDLPTVTEHIVEM